MRQPGRLTGDHFCFCAQLQLSPAKRFGQVYNIGSRTIVAAEWQYKRCRVVLLEIGDIGRGSAPEAIYSLIRISDDPDLAFCACQQAQQYAAGPADVLEFIYQDMLEDLAL